MLRILLVDDDESFGQGLAAVLRQSGLTVDYADGALTALDLFASGHEFDLLAIDVQLRPGEPDGLALARKLRLKAPRATIVHVAGNVLTESEKRETTAPVLRKSSGPISVAKALRLIAHSRTGRPR